MVSMLNLGSCDPSLNPGRGHATLTLSLSTQVYKWVPAKFNAGGNPAMDYLPIQGRAEILLVFMLRKPREAPAWWNIWLVYILYPFTWQSKKKYPRNVTVLIALIVLVPFCLFNRDLKQWRRRKGDAKWKFDLYFTFEFPNYPYLLSPQVGLKTCSNNYVTAANNFKRIYETLASWPTCYKIRSAWSFNVVIFTEGLRNMGYWPSVRSKWLNIGKVLIECL